MSRTKWVWLLLGVVRGSTWLFIKLGLEDVPPFTLAGLRFAFASFGMWTLLAVRRAKLPRAGRDWVLMIGTGLLTFGLDYGLVFCAWRSSDRQWRSSCCTGCSAGSAPFAPA